ncbi:hypothetical protein NQ317_010303 [Molorchus minor]|uniref:1-acylglycerol-3-phosphate O-acyltransferase n=1 Tax=Molorchus minor TaxID=1323400 RepID=A0ABQ9JMX8_9CUCU|nr:hypothetical protein NQ317_010303 [Molorchus minor]
MNVILIYQADRLMSSDEEIRYRPLGLGHVADFLGVTYSLQGQDNIVRDSGCVVLINHQSMLDLIVLACLWPVMDNCTVISKKEIFYLQPFGLASWLWGTIFIDRVNAKDSQNAINKTGETIRSRESRVLMFPEGTRNRNKKLLPFKKRCLSFSFSVTMPYSTSCGHIRIKILPPISTKGLTTDDLPKLMDRAYNIMSETVDLISRPIEENGTSKDNDKPKDD